MHCVVEVLNKKTGHWECFGVSTANRNYSLFSRIADVCNSEKEDTYIEPIDNPRGWPVDASEPANAWSNMIDLAFSATWLNRAELEFLNKWVQEQNHGKLWEILGFNHLSYIFDLETGWKKAAFTRFEDLRVLFFFNR